MQRAAVLGLSFAMKRKALIALLRSAQSFRFVGQRPIHKAASNIFCQNCLITCCSLSYISLHHIPEKTAAFPEIFFPVLYDNFYFLLDIFSFHIRYFLLQTL